MFGLLKMTRKMVTTTGMKKALGKQQELYNTTNTHTYSIVTQYTTLPSQFHLDISDPL